MTHLSIETRPLRFVLATSCLMAIIIACEDDDDDEPNYTADGGLILPDGAVAPPPDSGSPALDGQAVDAAEGGVIDPDGNVFRPVHRGFTQSRFNGLQVRPGFEINVYAMDMQNARMLAAHGQHIYLTRPMQGDIVRFIDDDENGVAESSVTVVDSLPGVHGIAFNGDVVYAATPTVLYRGTVTATGDFSALTQIAELPDGGQHPNRTLGVGPDSMLYISVGSTCDACAETDLEHATILQSSLDGSTRTVFASGLRNTLGFDWHPTTDELWGMDQGSDWRGDDLPPEELNRIEQDNDYGWPYCFSDRQVDAIIDDPPGTTKEAYCATTEGPVLETQAHGSPITLRFYTGTTFPEAFRNSAFLTLRGSWNREQATGYKVVEVRFDDSGEPVAFVDFVTGFLIEDGRAEFGRLAGLVVAADGSILFSDDENGVIYRVSHAVPDAGLPDAGDSGATDASTLDAAVDGAP